MINIGITVKKAKIIAEKYIEEPEANAGTPKIGTVNGVQVYVVPVVVNNTQVGEIHIDPKNGKNVGGAGGAPYG